MNTVYSNNPQAQDARARRAAKKVGLITRKSRWHANSADNWGGFMLIDPYTNGCVAGFRFDMSATEVIAFCRSYADEGSRP